MAEPSSTTGGAFGLALLLTAIGGAAGDLLGPWAIVLLGGVIGGGIGIGHMETRTLRAAWWTLFRGVFWALGFSGLAAVSIVPLLPAEARPLVLFTTAVAIGFRQLRLVDDVRSLWPGARRREPPPPKDDTHG